MPIKERSIVDADGLDGRGISGVDVGHDDEPLENSVCISICSICLYCKPTCFTSIALFCTLSISSIFLKSVLTYEDFRINVIFIAALIHPPLLVSTHS